MLTKSQKLVIEDAVNYYGESTQLLVLCEEMAELTQVILKYVNRKFPPFDYQTRLTDEFADVTICLEYLKMILSESEVLAVIDEKIQKFKNSHFTM